MRPLKHIQKVNKVPNVLQVRIYIIGVHTEQNRTETTVNQAVL